MTILKFLLIDAVFLLVGLPLLWNLRKGKDQTPFFGKLNSENMLDQSLTRLPMLEELLDLEALARTEGSGIDFPSLIGLWRFALVWKKGIDKEDSISSSLLRLFTASLELRENNHEPRKFNIVNSIEFGALSIRFIGFGELKETQPLLKFFFETIELKLGSNILFSRLLNIPDEKNRPFFALIAIEESGRWLSARGRGGGLALWLKD